MRRSTRITGTAIAGDGGFRVHIDETMELARDFEFSFGGMVHDGFRLPDTGSVLPPYLRPLVPVTSS